jgi:hypothetical protein
MAPSPHLRPSARARSVVRRLVDVAAIALAFAVVIALTLPPSRDHVAEAPSPVATRAPL